MIVTLIAPTATRASLTILSGIEETGFATAIKNTDVSMDALSIGRAGFHGEWNDTFVSRHQLENQFLRVELHHYRIDPITETIVENIVRI